MSKSTQPHRKSGDWYGKVQWSNLQTEQVAGLMMFDSKVATLIFKYNACLRSCSKEFRTRVHFTYSLLVLHWRPVRLKIVLDVPGQCLVVHDPLSHLANVTHGGNCLFWELAIRSLTGKHHNIRAIQNCVQDLHHAAQFGSMSMWINVDQCGSMWIMWIMWLWFKTTDLLILLDPRKFEARTWFLMVLVCPWLSWNATEINKDFSCSRLTSVASARVGRGARSMESNIWVAVTTNLPQNFNQFAVAGQNWSQQLRNWSPVTPSHLSDYTCWWSSSWEQIDRKSHGTCPFSAGALHQTHFFNVNFHTHVTTCSCFRATNEFFFLLWSHWDQVTSNHDSISGFDDWVDIVDSFLVLNLPERIVRHRILRFFSCQTQKTSKT